MTMAMFLSSRSLELSWGKDKKKKNIYSGIARIVSPAEEIM